MPNMKASLEIRKVNGIERIAVTTAMCGPSDAGIAPATDFAIASVMPVPLRMPVKIPAAKITEITGKMLAACAAMRCFCASGADS